MSDNFNEFKPVFSVDEQSVVKATESGFNSPDVSLALIGNIGLPSDVQEYSNMTPSYLSRDMASSIYKLELGFSEIKRRQEKGISFNASDELEKTKLEVERNKESNCSLSLKLDRMEMKLKDKREEKMSILQQLKELKKMKKKKKVVGEEGEEGQEEGKEEEG